MQKYKCYGEKMKNVEITTMCALFSEDKQKVLFINRRKNWLGYAFPGGHLEEGESIKECIIREMKEETGLDILAPKMVGITHFFNTQDKTTHIIINFVADRYEGVTNLECDEGELVWVDVEQLNTLQYAEGMELRLDLFLQGIHKEMYVEWNNTMGYTKVEKLNL